MFEPLFGPQCRQICPRVQRLEPDLKTQYQREHRTQYDGVGVYFEKESVRWVGQGWDAGEESDKDQDRIGYCGCESILG